MASITISGPHYQNKNIMYTENYCRLTSRKLASPLRVVEYPQLK